MTFGDVAFTPAVAIGVDRQAKGVVPLVDGAADMVVDPGGVAAHIQLKDLETVTRSFGSFVEPGMRYRAQDDAVAKGARRLGNGLLPRHPALQCGRPLSRVGGPGKTTAQEML
jgi:hypothetical protein